MTAALAVEDLSVTLTAGGRRLPVLEGLGFTVEAGRTLALVGESGCGKSVTALAIMRLMADGFAITGGRIRLGGEELTAATQARMQALRGSALSMVFQEPMTALNPVWPVGEQIAETLRRHQGLSRATASARALEMLRAVRIPAPETRLAAYPHQLSGGMRQRVMIAIALACRPRLLIADEPTTALDVTVQAQIFDLLRALQRETGTAMLLITHDLTTVGEVADEVAVLYAGRCIEQGPTARVLRDPAHPYTRGVLAAAPRLALGAAAHRPRPPLAEIPGMVPSLGERGPGCLFRARCPVAFDRCGEEPPLLPLGDGRAARCWRVAA